jgi:ribonuclease HI
MHYVEIHTDGSCLNNPGRGGYGAILTCKQKYKELSGGYRLTTNNRMELIACIAALAALKVKCSVTVYSDSKYLVEPISKGWVANWKRKNWRRSDGKQVENIDLWEKLISLIEQHQVQFEWVQGHNGNQKNERCDQLAREAANGSALLEDSGYINRGVGILI